MLQAMTEMDNSNIQTHLTFLILMRKWTDGILENTSSETQLVILLAY